MNGKFKSILLNRINKIDEDFLNENPESLNINGKHYFFSDLKIESYPFLKFPDMDEIIVSTTNHDTHFTAFADHFGLDPTEDDEYILNHIYKDAAIKGRIWVTLKIISFWGYISNSNVEKVKNLLKPFFPKENLGEYTIDNNKPYNI